MYPERMRENLDAGGGLAYSQGVLLALVDAGLSRDGAYRIVQEAAAAAWDGGEDFRAVLAARPEVAERLDARARSVVRSRLDTCETSTSCSIGWRSSR